MAMRSTMPPIAVPDKLEIHLTDVESSICDLLNDCSYYLQEEKGILVTCRIAGGWVRDKVHTTIVLSCTTTDAPRTAAGLAEQ